MTVNLLLVGDEPDAIELLRQRFRRARTAAAALLTGGAVPEPILLLSDINMPKMNGITLLKEVKRLRPSLRIIMITAYGDGENRRRAFSAGASDFVVKPVDFMELKKKLEFHVTERGAQ